ncbi:hypothetical protein ABZ942_38085 [Nocardia sp. NPDC046473]|uniref:hypothetical protein n=1 Tax=Nocardia sp. NPDC046473 TaxID=3155733 RepID=UPI0033D46CB0
MSTGRARRVMVRTVVAATLALAPAAVLIPTASAVPCRLPTDIGCTNPDGTLNTGPHSGHQPGGLNDSQYGPDGFDVFGYDRFGYNRFGYNRSGYDRFGYDRNGYTAQGCARNGADRPDADHAACEWRRSRPSTGSGS